MREALSASLWLANLTRWDIDLRKALEHDSEIGIPRRQDFS